VVLDLSVTVSLAEGERAACPSPLMTQRDREPKPPQTARWETESAGQVPHGHLHAAQEPERDDSPYPIIPTQQPYIY